MQIRLKNQISQRSVIRIRRSGIFQIISDVLSEVRRTDPWFKIICEIICIMQHWGRLTLFDLERVVSEPWLKLVMIVIHICTFCTVRTWDFAADSLRSSSLCSLWSIILSITSIVFCCTACTNTHRHTKLSEYFQFIQNQSIHIKSQSQKLTRQKLHQKKKLEPESYRRLQKIVLSAIYSNSTMKCLVPHIGIFRIMKIVPKPVNFLYLKYIHKLNQGNGVPAA